MIIGVCGFGSTGSSTVSDYLSEFNDVQVIDRIEFTWVTQTDGLIDLEYHLFNSHERTSDSICALRRYKLMAELKQRYYSSCGRIDKEILLNSTYSFLNKITMAKWSMFSYRNYGFFERLRGKVFREYVQKKEMKTGLQCETYPCRMISYSMMPEHFYDYAKEHVRELLTAFGADLNKDIVLDQPFSGNNPVSAFPFYDDPYAVVVDRDPRDLFCFARTRLAGRNHFMPVNSVKDFVVYYKSLRDNQPYKHKNPHILLIKFEDMIYRYDETTAKIRKFLNYPDNPNPRTVFNPEKSIANTQVYKRFPQFNEEIAYIEDNLQDYLYDFSPYKLPSNTEMFFGKSASNKNK